MVAGRQSRAAGSPAPQHPGPADPFLSRRPPTFPPNTFQPVCRLRLRIHSQPRSLPPFGGILAPWPRAKNAAVSSDPSTSTTASSTSDTGRGAGVPRAPRAPTAPSSSRRSSRSTNTAIAATRTGGRSCRPIPVCGGTRTYFRSCVRSSSRPSSLACCIGWARPSGDGKSAAHGAPCEKGARCGASVFWD